MVYRLRPGSDKFRLYQVEGTNDHNTIGGQYLSLGEEWKEKSVPFAAWWEYLFCISSFKPRLFNLHDGCASWYPELATNRRKSLYAETANIEVRGNLTTNERIEQHFLQKAFPEIYTPSYKLTLPDGDAFLRSKRAAAHVQGGFVFVQENPFIEGDVLYGRRKIGTIDLARKIHLYNRNDFFGKLLVGEARVSPQNITVDPPEPAKAERHEFGPLHPAAPPGATQASWRLGVYSKQTGRAFESVGQMVMPSWGRGHILQGNIDHAFYLFLGDPINHPNYTHVAAWNKGNELSASYINLVLTKYFGEI